MHNGPQYGAVNGSEEEDLQVEIDDYEEGNSLINSAIEKFREVRA